MMNAKALRSKIRKANLRRRAFYAAAISVLAISAYVFVSSAIMPIAASRFLPYEPMKHDKQDEQPGIFYLKENNPLNVYMKSGDIPYHTKTGVSFHDHEQALHELEGFLKEYSARVSELEAAIESHTRNFDEMESSVGELDGIASVLADEILVLQAKIDEYEAEVERLESNRIEIPAAIKHHAQEQLSFAGEFTLTAYCNCVRCCGRWSPYHSSRIGTDYVHLTAGGYPPTVGLTVAVDRSVVPMGTWLYIEGYGIRQAQDTGSGVVGNWVDMYMPTHEEALQIGRRKVNVWIIGGP